MSKLDELRATFFQEAEDLLEQLSDGLSQLEEGEVDPETVNGVFRAVHSIKGGAGAFGLDEVVRFAHRYENVLDALRNNTVQVSPSILDILTRAADQLTNLVEAARDGATGADRGSDPLIEELSGITGETGDNAPEAEIDFEATTILLDDLDGDGHALADLMPPEPAVEVDADKWFRIEFKPSPELFASGNEPVFLLREIARLGDAKFSVDFDIVPGLSDLDLDRHNLSWQIDLKTDAPEASIHEIFEFVDGLCDLSVQEMPAPTQPPTPEVTPEDPVPEGAETNNAIETKSQKASPVASTIRVELHRIDRMINLVGELVINQAMLTQCFKRADLPPAGDIDVGLDELRTLTRQIQDSVMSIRAQPVKSLFHRMSRIAREAATAVGKSIKVDTEGAGTEIDKTVIEKLADPLTHMIRNAVDHGLETTEERIARSKPESGTIRLSAAHASGRVVIEISDDGGGINRERVRSIAEEKGLIQPDAQLTPAEIDNLIFLPGFSTASTLSNLSGRGVGMDVVKRSIQSLGGRVSITSVEGTGSTFSIVLPLTLAVLDGMVVEVGGQTVVVPISAIIETMRLRPEHVFKLGTDSSVVRVRGNYVPIVDVGAVLGYRDTVRQPEEHVFLLVETTDGARAALLIDAIHDQRQVVIKGLEDNYGHVQGVAAATILGDGRIALILDPSAIVSAGSGAGETLAVPAKTLTAAE